MSSKTDNKSVLTYTSDVKIPKMAKSRLAELIEKARKSGLTFRDIKRRSGDQLPLSSLNAWHKSRPPDPNLTTETIMALAKGLGESPTIVFEAVIGKSSNAIKDESIGQLFEDYANLRPRDKEELRVFIEMLRAEVQKRLDRNA